LTEVNLDSFMPDQKVKETLKLLREKSTEELIRVVGDHICGIYGRPEAVEANLIAYHTPLQIIWKNEKDDLFSKSHYTVMVETSPQQSKTISWQTSKEERGEKRGKEERGKEGKRGEKPLSTPI
jgi:hypothetical protein